ncbi:MAG TPA: indole-3-glycerol phosphate synthase TrpC [Bacteroidales bacterium]|nr:indole-3-glycerol phosphate synthase TrpC [Bacteroidales bacterium]
MNNILQQIVEQKLAEVDEQRGLYPIKLLERSIYFETRPLSLKKYLLRQDLQGIIAEFKRRSPSKGMINEFADVQRVTLGYMQAGASALSVLTDPTFFGGSNKDLTEARRFNFCPVLRKDFIIDEYQVIEAKSIGADAVLLIAAILTRDEIKALGRLALSLGMEVVLEVHDESELDKLPDFEVITGINNRDLKTMITDLNTSFKLAGHLPGNQLKVSESGITSADDILRLRQAGYQGFLIGEYFMQHSSPQHACRKLVNELRKHANP